MPGVAPLGACPEARRDSPPALSLWERVSGKAGRVRVVMDHRYSTPRVCYALVNWVGERFALPREPRGLPYNTWTTKTNSISATT
jgi:hypothetical protein